jgi:O-antigen/teichoic acid export membrane protein
MDESKQDLRRGAMRGVFWTIVRAAGGQGTSFVVFTVLARLLAPADFGLIALASIYMALIQMIIEQGLGVAVVQRHELSQEHLDAAFWVNVGLGTLFAIITVVAAPLISALLGDERLTSVIRVLSLVFIIVGFRQIQVNVLKRRMQFRLIAIRTLIANVVGGIVGVGMALSGKGVWSLVGQQLAASGTGTAILWSVSGWRPKFRMPLGHLRQLWSVSLHAAANTLLSYARRRSSDFLIGSILGPAALGHMVIAQRLNHTVFRVITRTVSQVAFPTFSRVQHQPKRLLRVFLLVTRVVSVVSFPTFVALGALSSTIVPIFFGAKWNDSVPMMQIFAIGALYNSVGTFNGTVIGALGRTDLSFRLTLYGTALSMVFTYFTAPYGLVAVALGGISVSLIMAPYTARVTQSLVGHDFKTYFRQLVPSGASAAIMFFAILGVGALLRSRTSPYVTLAAQIIVGGAVYVSALYVISKPSIDEFIELVRGALKRGKKEKGGGKAAPVDEGFDDE